MTLLLRQLKELSRPQVDSIPSEDCVSERGTLLEDYSCDLFCK
jgi:hypothetical protein